MMKRRVNPESLLEALLCFVFALLLLNALISGRVSQYVHPRINGYLWFSAAALLLFSVLLLPGAFVPKRNARPGRYLLFLIPVLSVLLIPAGTVESKSISFGGVSATGAAAYSAGTSSQDNGTIIPDSVPSDDLGIDTASSSPSLPQVGTDGTVTIQDEQFAKWYQDINQDMEKYDGKTLKFKGQVFRMGNFAKNEFVPARYAMVCCTADLQPCGILCRSGGDISKYQENNWVWVTGKIKIEKYHGQTMPVCYVSKIEKAEKAQVLYIYFTY